MAEHLVYGGAALKQLAGEASPPTNVEEIQKLQVKQVYKTLSQKPSSGDGQWKQVGELKEAE